MKWFYELLITIILFFLICFVYKGQKRISLNEGRGWDGHFYYLMSEQVLQGAEHVASEFPYIKRIGTPYIVGNYSKQSGTNLLDSALIINLAGVLFTIILLIFFLRIFIDVWWIRTLLSFLFMMGWHTPLRTSFFYPMTTDAWGAVWFIAGLLLLYLIKESLSKNKNTALFLYTVLFSLVVGVGYLFRETNAVLAFALFFIVNPLKGLNINSKTLTISHGGKVIRQIAKLYWERRTLILFLPIIFLMIAMTIASNYLVYSHQAGYTYTRQIFRWFYQKSFPESVLGILIAYGPLLLLLPFYYKQFKSFFAKQQALLFLLIISLLFGVVGGPDTERITFMTSFPIVFVLIGFAFQNVFYSPQRWWLIILFFLQTIAFRFYWSIPDFPNSSTNIPVQFFTLLGDNFSPLLLLSHHGDNTLNTILLAEYFILFLATFYVIHNKVGSKLNK